MCNVLHACICIYCFHLYKPKSMTSKVICLPLKGHETSEYLSSKFANKM